jgi:DNA-directed RNA polymerase specialized sigma subunit
MADYLKNEELYNELKVCNEKGQLTDRAIGMFQEMIKNIIRPFSYKDNEDREDCQQQAMLDILVGWKTFDINHPKCNAFSYFTQTIKNGLAKGYNEIHDIKSTDKISMSGGDDGIYNI